MRRMKAMLQLVLALGLSLGIVLLARFFNGGGTEVSPEMIQTLAYGLMLLMTGVFIVASKKSLAEVGLFRTRLGHQLVVGGMIAAVFLIAGGVLTGWRFTPRLDSPSFLLAQALVVFTEELLFRGYVLAMFKDIVKTPERAVLLSALVFGLWHYPVSHNLALVLLTFFTGAVYGSLRTVFAKTDREIGILSISVAHWAMNVIL